MSHYENMRGWNAQPQRVVRCYETHPPMPVGEGLVIYGGSCLNPIIHDADIYVGFDSSIARSVKAYPWSEGESFLFHITDMAAPSNPSQFFKLLDWLVVQLTAGKKIHLGCIGGHGRTGTVLSALVRVMLGNKDATDYVRKNYCPKAVESTPQIEFLFKHFGITRVEGAKSSFGNLKNEPVAVRSSRGSSIPIDSRASLPPKGVEVSPLKSPLQVWGSNFVLTNRENKV